MLLFMAFGSELPCHQASGLSVSSGLVQHDLVLKRPPTSSPLSHTTSNCEVIWVMTWQVPGCPGGVGEAERGVPQGVEQGGAAYAPGDCAHRGHLRLAHGPVG